MEYTQGPWEAVWRATNHEVQTAGRIQVVADVYSAGLGTHEANANLIAAAPEMYEALAQVGTVLYAEYGRLRPQPRGPEWDNVQRLMRTIDAALAKAEGRTA